MSHAIDRRDFLRTSAAWGAAASLSSPAARIVAAEEPEKRLPRVAAINSIYRLRSHAYHIAGRFIYGYTKDGFHHQPPFKLVRMFNDQTPKDDLGVEVCDVVVSGERDGPAGKALPM